MKVLIVEDEAIAAEHLQNQLLAIDGKVEVLDMLDSVKSSVRWFDKNVAPDLLFLDIQLADGLSFEIFEKTKVDCPIIFTTAYDQYAIKAFKVNSVDYLLKPIVKEELETAVEKFKAQTVLRTGSKFNATGIDHATLAKMILGNTQKYKERFVIKVGEHLKTVKIGEVDLFYSQDRTTYLKSGNNQKYLLDYTLDQIEDMVDPNLFFRINRKYVVNAECIKDIITYSNSRLKIELKNFETNDMIVARERVSEFKVWLDR